MFKPRTSAILKILIGEYINTATPVASDDIARKSHVKVSPATIRSEMAGLEGEGYIRRPHISSGGIPSDKGYRFYVESLEGTVGLPMPIKAGIKDRFNTTHNDPEAWVQLATRILAQTSDNLAIATFPRATTSRLKNIQLIYIQEFLSLLVIVLQGTRIRQHLIRSDVPMVQEDLTTTANRLNEVLTGCSVGDIKAQKLSLTPFEERIRDDAISILSDIDTETSIDHCVDGLLLLLNQPEFSHTDRAKTAIEMVEEKILLRSILSEGPDEGSVTVIIGDEHREKTLRPFSVIIGKYGIPNELSGNIGVIGPTRMEYGTVIEGVRYLSSIMSDLLMAMHGSY